jgi:hypothetical protein
MIPSGATTAAGAADELRPARLFEHVESVRLELTLPESDAHPVATALGMDPLDAHVRLVSFLDTPDLALLRHGLVVRARRRRGRDDTMVALRPVTPRGLPRALRRSAAFALAIDAPPGAPGSSAWIKSRPDAGAIARVGAGDAPARGLFSPEQRALLRAHAPDGLGFDDLALLGPVVVLRPKFTPEAFGRRVVADLWMYPDGSRLLELATRCAPEHVQRAAAETREFLRRYGVDVTPARETGPERALALLAHQAAQAPGALTTGEGMPPGWPPAKAPVRLAYAAAHVVQLPPIRTTREEHG